MDAEGLIVTVLPGVTSDGYLGGTSTETYQFISSPSAGQFFVVQDGVVVWQMSATYPTMIAGTEDGIVYVGWMENGASQGKLQAYNFQTGELLWSYDCGFASYYLKLDADGNLLFSQMDFGVGSYYGPTHLVKLDKDTGEIIWSVYPDDSDPATATFDPVSPLDVGTDGYYYAPNGFRQLIKYGTDGTELWRAALPADSTGVYEESGYVVVTGIVSPGYVSTVTKIDSTTGAVLGVLEFDTAAIGLASDYHAVWGMDVVIHEGAIYISGIAFTDAALNPEAGNHETFVAKLSPDLQMEWTYLFGGNGDDLVGARGTSLSVQPDGTFTLITTSMNSTAVEGIPLETPQNLVLYTFRDTPGLLAGTASADLVIGSTGNDIVTSGAAADTITAGDGNDVVDAGAGNDLIVGGNGAGDDVYEGGIGTDTIRYTSALAGITVDLSTGRAGSSAGSDIAGIGTDTISGIENVIAGYFGDSITGDEMNNSIEALSGDDVIRGNGGFDTLLGGSGDDKLFGGSGNDLLDGGTNKDILEGGSGADQFIFNAVTDSSTSVFDADVITDFVRGTDKINLSEIDAFAATDTNDIFLWRGKSNFGSSTAGEVSYKTYNNPGTTNDYTLVFIDTDADPEAEMSIRVNGLHSLKSSDFIL